MENLIKAIRITDYLKRKRYSDWVLWTKKKAFQNAALLMEKVCDM